MSKVNSRGFWQKFLGLPKHHPLKTVGIAFLVALVCSLAVALTAVFLKPLQDANRLRESSTSLVELVEGLGLDLPKSRMVDLASGTYVMHNPKSWIELDSRRDLAGLGKRETVAEVYELHQDGGIKLLVLPIRGTGYQSVLKGYLALREDLTTIAALSFHEQNETPGVGGRITDKSWQALWVGKRIMDIEDAIRIRAVRGEGHGIHEVDGISGATRTVTGINNLLRFWLGPDGYGPYLSRLKSESKQ